MEKAGIAIVGYGGFGKKIAEELEKNPRCQVKYLYHPKPEKAEAYGAKGTSDWERILNDSEITAFIIATPNDRHFEILNKLVTKGDRHIFVEKPMVNTYEEARATLRASRLLDLRDKVFMVGHNQRREFVFRKAKEFLEAGKIGRLVSANINLSTGAAFNIKPDNWRYSAERHSLGPLSTLGSHSIDTIHYLFGRVSKLKASVKNITGKTEAPDCGFVMMELENGVTVFLETKYNSPSEKTCIITGTDGIIYINRNRISLRLGRDVNKVPSKEFWSDERSNNTLKEELDEFITAVLRTDSQLVETGIEEGFSTMAILEACRVSASQGSAVDCEIYYCT